MYFRDRHLRIVYKYMDTIYEYNIVHRSLCVPVEIVNIVECGLTAKGINYFVVFGGTIKKTTKSHDGILLLLFCVFFFFLSFFGFNLRTYRWSSRVCSELGYN